jgi:diguanylate cyclase (GGDEF)-like protein/PAS domain S-box-containing protein
MQGHAQDVRVATWSHEGPMFERTGIARRILPFTLGTVAIIVPLFFVPLTNQLTFLIGSFLGLLCVAVAMFAPWHRLPEVAEVVSPILGIVAVTYLRDGTGGNQSGYSVLMLLAVLWVALYGSPRQSALTILVMVLALAIPTIAVGEPGYPSSEWRRILTLLLFAIAVSWICHSLILAVRREALAASDNATQLEEQGVLTRQVVESASDAVITVDDHGLILELNPAAARLVGRPTHDLVGTNAMEVMLTPERAARASVALMELVSGQRAAFDLEAEIVRPDGTHVPIEVRLSASGESSDRRVHVFARDITDRRLAETRATEHLSDLDAILKAARTLSTAASAADARETICATARAIARADVAFYFERDPETTLVACTGSTMGLPEDLEVDQQRSYVALHYDNREATFVPDLAADERGDTRIARMVGVAAAFWQPVVSGDALLGVLVLAWKTPNPVMDERDRSLMEVLSTQVAGSVARGHLVEQLQAMARTDPLTGLLNRRAMTEALERDIEGARRRMRPMSIAMMDLDHFKAFNDAFGHQAGDRLLVNAAKRWTAELRPMDAIARYGGEEFLVLLPGCDVVTATTAADRLRAAVPDRQTCSIGVAQWDGAEPMSSLIERADAALYAAKGAGRNMTVAAGLAPVRPIRLAAS